MSVEGREFKVLTLDEIGTIEKINREKMPESDSGEQVNNPNIELKIGFSEEQAVAEANRCLQCGLICYRKSK